MPNVFVHVTGGFLKVHDHRRLSVVNFMLKISVLRKFTRATERVLIINK